MSFEETLRLQTIYAKKAMIVIIEMESRWANRNDSNAKRMRTAINYIAYQYDAMIYEYVAGEDSEEYISEDFG